MSEIQTVPQSETDQKEKPQPKRTTKKKRATKRKTKKAAKRKTKRAPAKKPAAKKTKQGRPPGSATIKKPESIGVLTRCRKCESTERSKYINPRTIKQCGHDQEGKPYNQITWKNTRCKNCNQLRVDKFFEMIPQES